MKARSKPPPIGNDIANRMVTWLMRHMTLNAEGHDPHMFGPNILKTEIQSQLQWSLHFSRSRNVLDHVTISFDICHFLWNRALSNGFGFWTYLHPAIYGHDLDLLSVTWCHRASDRLIHCPIVKESVSPAVFKILGRKHTYIHTHIQKFITRNIVKHVAQDHGLQRSRSCDASITWPFDSPYVISYWWSFGTEPLSLTVFEIFASEYIWRTTLTF